MSEIDILKKYDMTRDASHSGVESKIGKAEVVRGLDRGANRPQRPAEDDGWVETGGWVDVTPKLQRNTSTTEEAPKPVVPWMEEGGLGGVTSSDPVGAFLRLYVNASGDTYLQGGSITGGHGGSASIADIQVIDASSGPVAADGQILYVQANCTATVADGVMLPGCVLNSATTGIGGTVPPNHSFTTSALTGAIYLEIGRWAGGRFLPSGPAGNLYADGCIGSFSVTRI